MKRSQLTADPEYQAAREFGAESRLESSRKALANIAELGEYDGVILGISTNVSNLARVRAERLKADQWFAEREFPHRWGQKSELKVDATISVQLVRFIAEPPEKIVPSEPLDLLAISESAVK